MSQTVLITGAGSGLGRALAHHYARAGWCVGCADIREDRADQTRAQIEAAGGRALAFPVDIGDEASWSRLRDAVLSSFRHLDLLVNHAGGAGAGEVDAIPIDDWRWMLEINLLGVVRGCQAFGPHFRERRAGAILNVASFAALAGAPGLASYSVAKAGVVTLSESLRGELESVGVRVSVACPSFFQTNLLESFRAPDERMRRVADKLMKTSSIDADGIAARLAEGVARGRFLIIPTARERWLWRLKRWLPGAYHRLLVRSIAGKRKALAVDDTGAAR